MAGQMIIAGLDLGTHSIKCVIGVHHDDGKIDIIGRGAHPSNGFKNGVVSNKADAVQSVKAAVAEASLMADVDIKGSLFLFPAATWRVSTPMGWLESSMMRWTVMMYTR